MEFPNGLRVKQKQVLVFKIDFENEYDHVEWDFLDFTTEMKEFGLVWRK